MALDGIFLSQVKFELSDTLIGARVDKIYQPSKEEIIFIFRTKNGNKKLLISTSAGTARVHITTAEIENPKVPPMFCMLLRKLIGAGKLVDIRQDGFERILNLDFEATNEMGDPVSYTIAIEIMGKCSNLIIINSDNKIVDSIKRVGEDMSSVRMVLPGMTYQLPPKQDKLRLTDFNSETLFDRLNIFCKYELSKALMKIFEGISPVFARETAFFTGKGKEIIVNDIQDNEKDRLLFYLHDTANSIIQHKNNYTVIFDKDKILKDFCFTSINQYGNLMFTRKMDTACELLDFFYSERDLHNRIKQKSVDLFRFLVNTSERISRRLDVQRAELAECAGRDEQKLYGDLISANIYRLNKGMDKAILENFYSENYESIEIPLDKKLTPSLNAQRYYSEYRKKVIAEEKLTQLIKTGEEELLYIDSVADLLSRASNEADIIGLRLELAEQGYIKMSRQKGKLPKAMPAMKFLSDDGFTILVGRNNIQNDKLTLKDSSKNDLWLHTHNITGSHVIIITNGETVPDQTIEQACIIAAFHSKAKNSTKIGVDYTDVRFVKKPVGAKPGMVIFTNNKTAYVDPDPVLIERLKVKN